MEAPTSLDISFGRAKISATNGYILVGAPRNDDNGKVYLYHNGKLSDTFSKEDRSNQTFGNVFAASGGYAAIVTPLRPGKASGNGGMEPNPMLSPVIMNIYKDQGQGKMTKVGSINSTETSFGDMGIVIDKGVCSVASSGEKEKFENTCINLYSLSNYKNVGTVYPSSWGPLANPYRFSGFDYKDGMVVGLWNDGMQGYELGDNGPLRIWESPDSTPAIIENKDMIEAKVVNKKLLVAISKSALFTYTFDGNTWKENSKISPGKFIKGALTVSESGKKVAARVQISDSTIVMVFDVTSSGLSLEKGLHYQNPNPIKTGLAITDTVVYTGRHATSTNVIQGRTIEKLPRARLEGSELFVEEDENTDDNGFTPPQTPIADGETHWSTYIILLFLLLLMGATIYGMYFFLVKKSSRKTKKK